MVMTEEEVALEVMEGRSSRKEHAPRRVGLREERVLAAWQIERRGEERRTEGKSKRRSYPVHVDVAVRGELCA
jgi:hypothetical protein